jgi:hypothetical protein
MQNFRQLFSSLLISRTNPISNPDSSGSDATMGFSASRVVFLVFILMTLSLFMLVLAIRGVRRRCQRKNREETRGHEPTESSSSTTIPEALEEQPRNEEGSIGLQLVDHNKDSLVRGTFHDDVDDFDEYEVPPPVYLPPAVYPRSFV